MKYWTSKSSKTGQTIILKFFKNPKSIGASYSVSTLDCNGIFNHSKWHINLLQKMKDHITQRTAQIIYLFFLSLIEKYFPIIFLSYLFVVISILTLLFLRWLGGVSGNIINVEEKNILKYFCFINNCAWNF